MKPLARPFFRAAIASLEHAFDHSKGTEPGDLAQVLISLDHMCEMLLKAALVQRGETIFQKPRQTLTIWDALKKIGSPHRAEVEIIHEQRNFVQHFFSYGSMEQITEFLGSAWNFAEELAKRELGIDLESHTEARPLRFKGRAGEAVEPSSVMQRDAHFAAGLLVWAEASNGNLRVRTREPNGVTRWLTPADHFEYMPCTDGDYVAAYRQGGGVVLYSRSAMQRTVLSETGGPGAIEEGVVAAQGLAISGGLGGGIWLAPTDGNEPEQVAADGSSPRLSRGLLVWQELREEEIQIRSRRVSGGSVETVVKNGIHPSIHENLLVWTERGPTARVMAMDMRVRESSIVSPGGIFPNVRSGLIAFLEQFDSNYDLVIYDWEAMKEILRVQGVGFPTGRGPIVTDTYVVWEAADERGVIQLRRRPLPER